MYPGWNVSAFYGSMPVSDGAVGTCQERIPGMDKTSAGIYPGD